MPEAPYRALTPPFEMSNVAVSTPDDAYISVLASVGARPAEPSSVDVRIINEVLTGTGSIKDCVSGCTRHAGGWPQMAENYRSLTLPEDPTGDADGDGYTNLEEWLHGF
jgi:hypothetical protein